MKVVINSCYGGFSISKEAAEFMAARGNQQAIEELEKSLTEEYKGNWYGYVCTEDRANPDLVAAVEELGSEVASGSLAKLKVIQIPDGIEWEIEEYDGTEWVAEKHETWS